MANLGEKKLSLEVERNGGDHGLMDSVFQIAQVTRPLMSVGKICDAGFAVAFSKDIARVTDKSGKCIADFHRTNGGLYIAQMKIKQPSQPFGRPE